MIALDRLAKEVRNAREKAGLSQRKLAEKLNMSVRTIIDLENCQSNPRGETIFLIAAELHISLDAILYTGTAQPNSVGVEVLDFFSGKSETDTAAYIRICREIEKLRKNEIGMQENQQ